VEQGVKSLRCIKCGSKAEYVVVLGLYGLVFGGSMCSDCYKAYEESQMKVLRRLKEELEPKEA
jgi:protein-arginine kinase activator protein McsA